MAGMRAGFRDRTLPVEAPMIRRLVIVTAILLSTGAFAQSVGNSTQNSAQVQDVRKVSIIDPAKLNEMSEIQLEALGDEMRGNKEMLQAVDC